MLRPLSEMEKHIWDPELPQSSQLDQVLKDMGSQDFEGLTGQSEPRSDSADGVRRWGADDGDEQKAEQEPVAKSVSRRARTRRAMTPSHAGRRYPRGVEP